MPRITAARVAAAALIAVLASACTRERPEGVACPSLQPGFGTAFVVGAPGIDAADEGQAVRRALVSVLGTPAEDEFETQEFRPIIAFSAGGTWGAFGAGVLNGWEGRPEFRLATGVSTGSILAYFAFAGPEYDEVLRDFYRDAALSDAYRTDILGAIAGRPAIASPRPIERLARRTIPPALPAVRKAADDGDVLLIGATDLEDSLFHVMDASYAAGQQDAEICVREAILASAAIPLVAPPRVIGGDALVDGGVRHHIFFRELADAAERGELRPRRAYVVVNGELAIPPQRTPWTLFGVGSRSYEILLEQSLLSSLKETLNLARVEGWDVLAAVPQNLDLSGCKDKSGAEYERCRSRALFDLGVQVGRDESLWLDADELEKLIHGN